MLFFGSRRLSTNAILPDAADPCADGITDEVVLPLTFSNGDVQSSAWATTQPGGFTDPELAALRRLASPLARVIEIMALRRMGTVQTDKFDYQPAETAASFPDNAALIDTARQAGAGDATADCINSGAYNGMVAGRADATNVAHTPTVRINGHDYELSTPDALVATIKAIVGPVPGIDAPAGTP